MLMPFQHIRKRKREQLGLHVVRQGNTAVAMLGDELVERRSARL